MDLFWNTSLKYVQVQFLTQKTPKKRVQIEPKEENEPNTQECRLVHGKR